MKKQSLSSDPCTVTKERLQLLAKKASLLHTDSGMGLNDAVLRTLNGESDLGEEHVRRVVEMTNQYAFASLFKRANAGHKVINFDGGPADPASVIQDMRGVGAMPIRAEKYAMIRPEEKYMPGQDSLMARAAARPPMQKTASARMDSVDICKLANDLLRAKESLGSELISLRLKLEDEARGLHKEAMALVHRGHSPAELSRIISSRLDQDMAKYALKTLYQLGGWDKIPAVPVKVASVWINPEHGFVKRLDSFAKTAEDHFAMLRSYEIVVEQQEMSRALVKEILA